MLVSVAHVLCATYDPYRLQTISGYIDDISYLYVSPFRYEDIVATGFAGINLDVNDTSNKNRTQIAPSTTSLSQPGVQIGTFSVLATYTQSSTITSVKLIITHNKLVHTTDPNTELEYELAVLYAIGNGTTTGSETKKYCYSTSATSNNRIEIDLSQSSKISAIQNGYIYFRLAKNQTATVAGQYESIVTFAMEAL